MGIESTESSGLARETRRLHQERTITAAYPRAHEFLTTHSIDPRNFIPPYDEIMVERDVEHAKKKAAEFTALANTPEKKFLNKSATVLEAVSLDGVRSGWFVNAKKPDIAVWASHTAPHDDIVNGIDIITEFTTPGASDYTGLAIDVTYGNANIVKEKIQDEEKKILKGELSELKYFETENYHGRLRNVPRVIIGIDLGHVVTLAEKWITSPETIGEDPMQIIVLREIAKQCEHFASIAREEKKHLRGAATPEQINDGLMNRLDTIIAVYEKNQNMFLEILRNKPMAMRSLVTDKYPDRVSENITSLIT